MSSIPFQTADQAVREAINIIFDRWTALELTIEHQMGGNRQAVNRMIETTLMLATSVKPRYTTEHISDYFYQEFDRMQTDIEDGSAEQVAASIIEVRDAAGLGDFSVAAKYIANSASGITNAAKDSVVGSQGEFLEPADKMTDEASDKKRPEPVVDDDGFTMVDRCGSHR